MNFHEHLEKRGVALSYTGRPNPVRLIDGVAHVDVLYRDGSVKCTFLVDEDDYEEIVRPHRWHAGAVTHDRIYTTARRRGTNCTVLLHRWLLNPPADKEVDHINHRPLDNRRSNLRIVTRKQNEENGSKKRVTRKQASKHRGVHLCKQTGRWRAQVTHNYKAHKSPRFDAEEEAAEWATAKRLELFSHNDGDRT